MFLTELIDEAADFIMHYGVGYDDNPPGRGSGRYPKGSGDLPFQHAPGFLDREKFLKAKHPDWNKTQLAAAMGCINTSGVNKGQPSSALLESEHSKWVERQKAHDIKEALRLYDEGYSKVDIGRKLGLRDTTVGNYIREGNAARKTRAQQTSVALKEFVDKYKYVDVGSEVNNAFNYAVPGGVSPGKFATAIAILKEKGYSVYPLKLKQAGNNHYTTYNVMVPPGVSYSELTEHKYEIKTPGLVDKVLSPEGELTSLGMFGKVQCINSNRIQVAYDSPKDGLIELRRGVDDLSLGPKSYAQIRIGVDDGYYLKGMAGYRDDMPPGIDVIYHSKRKEGTPLYVPDDPDAKQVLKHMKTIQDENGKRVDWDNPFGAYIDQTSEIMSTTRQYYDKDGIIQKSAINVLHEESDWDEYSRSVSPQLWSKQSWQTAERQLTLAADYKKVDLDSIRAVENPTIRKHLLLKFADECDAAAVDLKAAPFRGQATCVLLPEPSLKDNEVYAPRYKDGDQIILVRYPHAGAFESPMLTVRNTGSPAQKLLPMSATDAVCVNKNILNQMSGADVDGDFVITIPVKGNPALRYSNKSLPGLKGFDPQEEYAGYEGMKKISHKTMQIEMGKVTNLMTDMYFQIPDPTNSKDYLHATMHSMTIIDSEKHGLDWKRSEQENGIRELKLKYQVDSEGRTGAGTIISRASAQYDVPEREEWVARKAHYTKNGKFIPDSIDDEGNKVYTYTNAVTQTGKLNLKDVSLTTGKTVDLHYDKDEKRLYYTDRSKKDPVTNKVIRQYVDDPELPENLRGLKIKPGGWVYLNTDKKAPDAPYYVRTDETTHKSVRVYVKDNDVLTTKTAPKMQESTRMAEEKDAFKLTSGGSKEYPGHEMERVAAEYSNTMKGLAREARLEWKNTGDQVLNKEAKKKYAKEIASLNEKLAVAESNAPRERAALLIARRTMAIKKYENPNMSAEEYSKKEGQAIVAARDRVGAKKKRIEITPDEYKAISSGAIGKDKLERIMNNTNLDSLRAQATPKTRKYISPSVKAMIKRLAESGAYGNDVQLADRFNISPSYLSEIVNS